MKISRFGIFACVLAAALCPMQADAWGAAGQQLIVRVAFEGLPDTMPAFVRAQGFPDQIAVISSEAENVKGAGNSADHDLGPADYVQLGDDGRVMGVLALTPLPDDREAYDSALRKAGTDEYKAGYLPYAIIDSFEVVRRDFAYWRAFDAMARTAKTDDDKAYFGNLRSVRESLTTRDLGVLSRFVGSGSSPLHVTMHSDGWDKYPGSKGILAKFERYPSSGIKEAQIKNRLKAYTPCNCTLEEETTKYLADSASQVERLYQLSAFGAFDAPTNAGTGFTVDRLATGATELRNLIAAAWQESADQTVGTPPVKVSDVEKGAAVLTKASLDGE
jgi:hypothetical protein